MTPLRGLAVVYTDVVRGIPTILLVFLFVFGVPGLKLAGLTNSIFFWATVALVVSYSAYVAEVFRAGIESVHPSQVTSAEALALSRGQTMRYVVVPQAPARRTYFLLLARWRSSSPTPPTSRRCSGPASSRCTPHR